MIIFHHDGNVKSIAGLLLEIEFTANSWVLLDECLLCGSLDKFKFKILYGGILAPGFECHISQARYNNTPPLVGISVYLLYRLFCHYKD